MSNQLFDRLKSLEHARDELDSWGDYEDSESSVESLLPPPEIYGDNDPSNSPDPLWLAVVELQKFYPKNRLPKLNDMLDAWSNLLKYSRQHGNETQAEQVKLALKNAQILRKCFCREIKKVKGEIKWQIRITDFIRQSAGDREDDNEGEFAAPERIRPPYENAYLSFLYAESIKKKRLEDREAWEWLKENGIEVEGHKLQEYQLPNFDTWARYLRMARNATGEQKYTPRGSRAKSRSIVRSNEIEHQTSDEE